MGNLSSSPDCSSQTVFYNSSVEGVSFRGPARRGGPSGDHDRGSTDSDGFVVVSPGDVPREDDRESGVSLSTSPESEETHNLFPASRSSNSKHRHLHIDIPYGHNQRMNAAASSRIHDPDEVDAGLGFSPSTSQELQTSDDTMSISGHSMKANFSPVSLHERYLKLDDSLSDFGWSSSGKVKPMSNSKRKHSTPLSESLRSMSGSSSFPEELKSANETGAANSRKVPSSHSSFSLGVGESFEQSSFADSRSQSADFSDSLSGIATPDSELFSPVDVGLQTQEGMDILESDLREVQQEISEISEKIHKMCARENLTIPSAVAVGPEFGISPGPKSPEVQKAFNVINRHRHNSSSNSHQDESTASDKDSSDSGSKPSRTFNSPGEFMWDRRSDLFAAQMDLPEKKKFLNHWTTLDDRSESSSSPSHTTASSNSSPLHGIRKAPPSHSASSNSFSDLTPDSSRHGSVSVNDLYIDDGLSDLALRTDSRVSSLDSPTEKSGSFPSSIASSTHTSPHHPNSSRAAVLSPLVAADMDNLSDTKGSDASNNNAAADVEISDQTYCFETNPSPSFTPVDIHSSLDANRNPTVMTNTEHTTSDILNIGPKLELTAYAEKEWKGATKTSRTIKQVPFIRKNTHDRQTLIFWIADQCLCVSKFFFVLQQ